MRVVLRALALLAAFFLAQTQACARGGEAGLAGTWELQVQGVTLFRLVMNESGGQWSGTFERPEHFRGDGSVFTHVSGGVSHAQVCAEAGEGGSLILAFTYPSKGAAQNETWTFTRIDDGHARLAYDASLHFDFTRVDAPTRLGPWKDGQRYEVSFDWPTNPEMTALFEADQADRKGASIDWAKVSKADEARRARTRELLDAGALHSGDDFEHAAFVFQHGDEPDDYLVAHLLAMVAVARGNRGAVWIGAATLDRYLLNIGRPQVLGTQFRMQDGKMTKSLPFACTLVPDALREVLHVPAEGDCGAAAPGEQAVAPK